MNNNSSKEEKIASILFLFYILWVMFYLPKISIGAENVNTLDFTDEVDFEDLAMAASETTETPYVDEKGRVILHDSNYVTVLATKYNAVKSQCDSDPLITADNSKIDLKKLNKHQLRWIAVSQEMTKVFNLNMGDKVFIECDNPKINGIWEIHDHMNKRFSRRIDLLVPLNDKYNFDRPMKVKLRKVNERNCNVQLL